MTIQQKLEFFPDNELKKAILTIVNHFEAEIKKEDAELHKMGVAWPSAHTEAYRSAKYVLKRIDVDLGDQYEGEEDASKEG